MRLAARAARRQPDGSRTLPSQWALVRLARAGDRSDQAAVDALWERWLDEADAAFWELLARWRRPAAVMPARALSCVALGDGAAGAVSEAEFRAAVVGAARTSHPVGETARARILADGDPDLVDAVCAVALEREVLAGGAGELTGFCVEHHLAPADPVRRAVFLLLTGQPDQHAAVDPDGSLLALGYESATDAERERLRKVMVSAGDLPLLRVVAGGDPRERLARMTAAEVGYLTAQLSDRRDWDELWRLTQGLAPVVAVETVRQFPGEWRPADSHDRELFELLLDAGGGKALAARSALAKPFRVETEHAVWAGAFAPDGRRMAVYTPPARSRSAPNVVVYDLAGRTVLEEYRVPDTYRHLLAARDWHLRSDRMLFTGGRLVATLGGVSFWLADGRVEVRPQDTAMVIGLAPRRRGFVALQAEGVVFRNKHGTEIGRVHGPDAGFENHWRRGRPLIDDPAALAAEPVSRRLAVAGRRLTVLRAQRARESRALESTPLDSPASGVCFAGPDRLVTVHPTGVRLWMLVERPASAGYPASPPLRLKVAAHNPIAFASNPVFLPHRGEIVLLDEAGQVRYLDADTLALVEGPRELSGRTGRGLWSVPKGRYHSLDNRSPWIDVVLGGQAAAVAALADRPLAAATPADLKAAARARSDPVLRAVAGPLLDLLWDCLRHRFATEVGLGEIEQLAAAAYDIALSEDEEGEWAS